MRTAPPFLPLAAAILALVLAGCSRPDEGPPVLTAGSPLHLEDHLDVATVEGAEVPADLPKTVEWRFDRPQPGWRPAYLDFRTERARLAPGAESLRLVIDEKNRDSDGDFGGALYVDVPDWRLHDWAYVAVTARVSPGSWNVQLGFNLTEPEKAGVRQAFAVPATPMMADGTIQTYLLSPNPQRGKFDGVWRQLVLVFWGDRPGGVELVSVTAIPKEAAYASAPVAVANEVLHGQVRRTLYTHAPGKVSYRVRIPEEGRLDLALRTVRGGVPVMFRVTAKLEDDSEVTFHEETSKETDRWQQRQIDLSRLAGQVVTLALAADADRPGVVALWGTPTLSGARHTDKPNVILYVIDGAGADFMSVYGYNRRTTPRLERLAAEGVVFDHAYANATWTRPSTASFLSSLQHSALGGLRNSRNMVPEEVLTIPQHLGQAGYQTALLTSNPNAGTMSGLGRGIDILRDSVVGDNSTSSVILHDEFSIWREAYPGEPYWVHFQPTDVHSPNYSPPPFAGLYVSPQERVIFKEWERRLGAAGGYFPYSEAFEKTGISRQEYFQLARGLYDESMAHQDYQLGRLVDRLKAAGEWDRTLLIVTADHGHIAGSRHFGVGLAEPLPAVWAIAMASSFHTRVPLMMIWPDRIRGGLRIQEPVSLIDLLPTVVDLAGLPAPELMQGQSLAPLLFGRPGWEPRPVVLDEFEVDRESGKFYGTIEVIDGRWAASLYVDERPEAGRLPLRGHHDGIPAKAEAWKHRPERTTPLLLYDLRNDARAFYSVHEQHPELVARYTRLLEQQWRDHQALGRRLTRPAQSPLTPEQLRTLRALGYIQ